MRHTTKNYRSPIRPTTEWCSSQVASAPSGAFPLWSKALARLHGEVRDPKPVQTISALDPRLEQIGRLIGVHRREFESDWAFCRYLQIRLGYFLNDDIPRHVSLHFRALDQCCGPNAKRVAAGPAQAAPFDEAA